MDIMTIIVINTIGLIGNDGNLKKPGLTITSIAIIMHQGALCMKYCRATVWTICGNRDGLKNGVEVSASINGARHGLTIVMTCSTVVPTLRGEVGKGRHGSVRTTAMNKSMKKTERGTHTEIPPVVPIVIEVLSRRQATRESATTSASTNYARIISTVIIACSIIIRIGTLSEVIGHLLMHRNGISMRKKIGEGHRVVQLA